MGQRAPTAPTTSVSARWIYALVSTNMAATIISGCRFIHTMFAGIVKITLII